MEVSSLFRSFISSPILKSIINKDCTKKRGAGGNSIVSVHSICSQILQTFMKYHELQQLILSKVQIHCVLITSVHCDSIFLHKIHEK